MSEKAIEGEWIGSPSKALQKDIAKVNREYELSTDDNKTAAERKMSKCNHAIKCGQGLLKIKQEVGHGSSAANKDVENGGWKGLFSNENLGLKGGENLRFSFEIEQARLYMRTAKQPKLTRHIVRSGSAENFNLDATIKAISAASPELLERYDDKKKAEKEAEREADLARQAEEIAAGKLNTPPGPFGIIVVDPPWPYTEHGSNPLDTHGHRAANPYPEMSLDEIRADGLIEVAGKADDDCVLWLWTTHKFMRHSFELLDAWGFEDKAILTWVKNKMGLGNWLRSKSEFCIMAIKGKPTIALTNQTTVLNGKAREHSRKPDEFYVLVESLCLNESKKYDRFARELRDDWECSGNDPQKFQ